MKPPETPHSRYQALLQVLRTADRIWNASRIFFDHWQLSPSQFNVLNLLQAHPEGLSQIELSRQLIMHRSNVTGLIDRLERRGLVRRKELAGDRRAYRVVLIPAGDSLLSEILPHFHRKADAVWEGLPPKRIAQMTADLKQMAENAERIGTQKPSLAVPQSRTEADAETKQ